MENTARRRKTTTSTLTRLMLASATGQVEVVHSLLLTGEDANTRGPRGSTALMFAAGAGHLDVVKELVAFGADVDAQEDGGWCARRHAEEDGNEEIATFLELVERGKSRSRSGANEPNLSRAK